MSLTLTEESVKEPRTLIRPDLFNKIVNRLATEHDLNEATATRYMDQALSFLWASAENPGAFMAPPIEVDWGWHMFILHTKEYAEFCDRIAGRFMHHEPADGLEDGGEAIQRTAEVMRAGGFPVDEELWRPEGTGCTNTCHMDCNRA